MQTICCFCGKACETPLGNNPEPFYGDNPKAGCCNACDEAFVIPARKREVCRFDISSPEVLEGLYNLEPLDKHIVLLSAARVWWRDILCHRDTAVHKWYVLCGDFGAGPIAEVYRACATFPMALLPYGKVLRYFHSQGVARKRGEML